MAARTAPPNPTGLRSSRPTLRRSTKVQREARACSGGHKGRPYALPSTRFVGRGAHTPANPARRTRRACKHRNRPPVPVVGAAFMAARAAPPNPTGMQSSRPTLRRSTKVQREARACSGGHKGRPYAMPSTRSVGRGAHTPPTQPAGTAKPASIATGRQSSRRGGLYGRLCRTAEPNGHAIIAPHPTSFDEGAAGNAGLFRRP